MVVKLTVTSVVSIDVDCFSIKKRQRKIEEKLSIAPVGADGTG
jgi:hypothetical protein